MATILVVDDLSANREYLVALLGHHGHRMLEAADGSEGLVAVRRARPDLVITDILMPVMDGFEFVRQLRNDPEIQATPIVFYTAHYGARESKALVDASGVSHVLVKPVTSAEVLRVVGLALSKPVDVVSPAAAAPLTRDFDHQHLRLVTDKLSQKAGDLITANARLTALINIGAELASEGDSHKRLQGLCDSARELFDPTYVTLGMLDRNGSTLHRIVVCGDFPQNWIRPGGTVPGILGRVISERRTFRGHNPRGDPALLDLPPMHPQMKGFLAAPIATLSRVFGWICLVGNDGRVFNEEDEHLVEVLAGQVGRIYELEHEVIDRKQAELAVRVERDRAQRSLDTAEVILLALDLEGCITLVNRYACSVLGWTADELMGANWIDTCLPENIRAATRVTFAALLGGDLSVVESYVVTRSGERRLIEWRNTLLHNSSGQVTGTFSSGADITERSQATEALRTAEERTRFALESAGVGIWDIDYATGLVRFSEILEAQYGMEAGAFDGTFATFVEHIHPEDRDSVLETINTAVKSGADFALLHRTIWQDGSVHWLSGAGRIHLGNGGLAVRGVGITLDVTDRHRLEEQYGQAQKMEAIGRLAGGVAHDFNNLLTVILGHCELMMLDSGSVPDLSGIEEIQKAGTSAAGLTRQLLAFSRKQIIEPVILSLNDVVANVHDMLRRLIGEDVELSVRLQPELSLVKADRGQIEQIIMNLALNARDAMPSGGTLTIETRNVELDDNYAETHLAVTPGPYVALMVTDTGSGIRPEVRDRLFEPFFTTKAVGVGTGLGLATVHGIVTGSGGSIGVYTEIGMGTSFTVYLPRSEADGTVVRVLSNGRHTGGETILVVDDAEGLRDLTKKLLTHLGYHVLVAADAAEAVVIFESTPNIDVVVTDVVMPGASGPELTRTLIARRPGIKVIFMSGYTEEAIVHHGVIREGVSFLHKPFTSQALGLKIRELLDSDDAGVATEGHVVAKSGGSP